MGNPVTPVNIRGKMYITVNDRLRIAHATCESLEVISSMPLPVGDNRCIWQVLILVNGRKFTASAEVHFNAAKGTPEASSPYETAETSALGRALLFAGIGLEKLQKERL